MNRIYLILTFLILFNFLFSQTEEDHLYIKASIQYDTEEYDKAISVLNEILAKNKKDPKVYLKLGDCYKQKIEIENAVDYYAKAVSLKNYTGLYKIAQIYSLNNESEKSTEYLKEYLQTNNKLSEQEIKLNPAFKNIEQSREWAMLWKNDFYNNYEKKLSEAKYLISSNRYNEAYEILDNLLYKNKNRHRAIALRADLLMLNNEYKNAAKEYSKASELKRKNIIYKEKAANAYNLNNNYKTSLKIYKEILESESYRADLLLIISELNFHLKDYEESEVSLIKYLSYYPNSSKARYLSGQIFEKKGNNLSALEQYNKCIELDNTKYTYFVKRADLLAKLDQPEAAVYDFSMALDLNPSIGEIYFKRALVHLKNHDYNNACSDFKKADDLNYHKSKDYLIKYCK